MKIQRLVSTGLQASLSAASFGALWFSCGLALAQPVDELAVTRQAGGSAVEPAHPLELPRIRSISASAGQAGNGRALAEKSMPIVYKKNAFEENVATVTGMPVELFGQAFFRDLPSTLAPSDSSPVNADYVIGSGDELDIRAWGMVDLDVRTAVDRNGAVNIPRVGTVNVAGIKYRDLKGHLSKAVARIFNNFELTVSVAQSRSVQVYVVGHAVHPGAYTLNGMSTLLNALSSSGGADGTGSMRRIQVKRGNETVTTFDLYDVLIKGDKGGDVGLRDGDVIYIPEAGPLVAVTGNVKKPAIYEMKGQTSIADLVAMAGGFDSSTEGKAVVIEKNKDNVYGTVGEVAPGATLNRLPFAADLLAPGDLVRVFAPGAIPVAVQTHREFVRVEGEMRQSGVFEIQKGETLREIVARLGGPNERGYLFATKLVRDSVRIAQQARLNDAADRFEKEINAVASQRMAATSDKDTAALVAADMERQRRLAEKLRQVKAEGRIVLELTDSNAQVKDLPDLPLQDGDKIVIPRKPGTVDVLGAVFQQNAIVHRKNRTVGDYLSLAGGVTDNADKSEMYVIRADGTATSARNTGWMSGLGGSVVNAGDSIIVPEKINRGSWTAALKEWTSIFYQFGLGAAGLKVLKD